ncbi:hypothetical protein ZWY2020_003418 [Hordeum vulgare]|nr:hypothetical protein ZWY2020_003418 [Hordeum vulgare]
MWAATNGRRDVLAPRPPLVPVPPSFRDAPSPPSSPGTGASVLRLAHARRSLRPRRLGSSSGELRRQMNLISKVFSADKMNHAKTQGGPRGLHTWRSGKGLGCYQGDPNGVSR